MRFTRLSLVAFLVTATAPLLMNCASGGGSGGGESLDGGSSSGGDTGGSTREERRASSGEPASAGLGESLLFTTSLSNSALTSKTYNRAKADSEASRLAAGSNRDQLEAALSAQRLAGQSQAQLQTTLRKLAEIEMRTNIEREISDDAKLEVALAALQNNKLQSAEFQFYQLSRSKGAKIRAAALTGLGIISQRDKKLPEAASFWKEALKASSNFEPAALNLGMLALEHGDFVTAKAALNSVDQDWYVRTGLIVVEKLSGNNQAVQDLCDKVTAEQPQYKPALYNCGVFEYQATRNLPKAKALMTRMVQARIGGSGYDDKAYKLLTAIDQEASRPAAAPQPAATTGSAPAPEAKPASGGK